MIYITSDWHFCHSRDFIWRPRGFNNEWEMNEAIIKNHNAIVKPEDDVYCLGDIMLNDDELGLKCLKQLKGNIHIIRGNHDTENRMDLYNQCYNVVEICEGKFLKYGKYSFYLSHYPCLCNNFDDSKPLKAKVINLCGHSHTKDSFIDWDKGIIFHTEVDTNNCKPWLLDNIIDKINFKIKEK